MKITYDNRIKNKNKDTVVSSATCDDAISILNQLDGKKHTLVLFENEDASQMMVGGGPENFIITLLKDDNNLALRRGNANPESVVEICAGGQFGDYPEYLSNTKETAAAAIESFFQSKEGTLDWI